METHGVDGTTHFQSFDRAPEITLRKSFSSAATLLAEWFFLHPCLRCVPRLVSFTIWAILRARQCQVGWYCCTFVGRPFLHVYSSGSLVLKIWNLVVPIHSSGSATPLSPPQQSSTTCGQSRCLCLFASASSRRRTSWKHRMFLLLGRTMLIDVHRDASKRSHPSRSRNISRFLLRRLFLKLFSLRLARSFSERGFHRRGRGRSKSLRVPPTLGNDGFS